jgi:hypothetical protein
MAQTPKLPPLPPEIIRAAEEFNNRKKYAAFDLETLKSIKNELLEQALLDYIFVKFEARPGQEREVIDGLSREFQAFYVSWLVEAQVLNGGFNQFFWNPSSKFAEDAPAALKEIGDEVAAEIMQQAIAVAIEEIPIMTKFRQAGTLEAFSKSYEHTKLHELDEPFSIRAMSFPELRLRYVRQHEDAFITLE